MNIKFEVTGGPKVAAAFKRKATQLQTALAARLTRLLFQLQQKIVTEKLSGQVLNQRTGVLAGSVAVKPTKVSGSTLIGYVTAGTGPAWYGRVHEYGSKPFDIVPVNKKVLRFMIGSKEVFAKRVRHPGFPERSFMRSSLKEMEFEIQSSLQNAINEALKQP